MAGSAVTLLKPADVRCLQNSSAVLANAPGTQPATAFVCVGDTIDTDQQDGYLRCLPDCAVQSTADPQHLAC